MWNFSRLRRQAQLSKFGKCLGDVAISILRALCQWPRRARSDGPCGDCAGRVRGVP